MKIDKETYQLALNSAIDALSVATNNAEWVKSSSLTERAYFLGVAFALDAISDGDHLGREWIKIFSRTLFLRYADDTFSGTQVGELYSSLIRGVNSTNDLEIDSETLTKLSDALHPLDEAWRSASAEANRVLGRLGRTDELVQMRESGELKALLNHLEGPLRVLTLVQTSHKIQDRLEHV